MGYIIYRRWEKTILELEEKKQMQILVENFNFQLRISNWLTCAGYQGLCICCNIFESHMARKI